MFHPSKAWKMGLAATLQFHNMAKLEKRFVGGAAKPYPLDPFAYVGDVAGATMLLGAGSLVTDQRMSGMNALLLSDPSLIL